MGKTGEATGADLAHLPGERGLPLAGHLPALVRDPVGTLRTLYQRHGEVFTVNLLGTRMVMLLGPDANEFLLTDRGQVLSSRHGWDFFIGPFFHNGIMLRDFDEHRFHRRILQQAFRKPVLVNYLAMMQPDIARGLERWLAQDRLLVYPAVKALTLDLASTVFLGQALGREADTLNRAFVDCVRAGSAYVRYPVPGLAWARGLRSRKVLDAWFAAQVPARRRRAGDDTFTLLCHALDEDGNALDDRDVVDHMVFLLMAAHDTTTITLTNTLYQLARHPQWQERLREESLALGPGPLAFADLEKLTGIDRVMKESLRLIPPVPGLPRRAVRDVVFAGHRLPAGALLNIPLNFSHQMPEYWNDPWRFDPERFAPARAEHRVHPYAWCPFGGGAHMCLGLHFAELQVKAVLHRLLCTARWAVPAGYRMPVDHSSLPTPRDGLPVRIAPLPRRA